MATDGEIKLSEGDIPGFEDIEEGEEVKLQLTVKKSTPTNDGIAKFTIENAQKEAVTEQDRQQAEEQGGKDNESLQEIMQEEGQRQEVLSPGSGQPDVEERTEQGDVI